MLIDMLKQKLVVADISHYMIFQRPLIRIAYYSIS